MVQLYHVSSRSVIDERKTQPHREATHNLILKIAKSEIKLRPGVQDSRGEILRDFLCRGPGAKLCASLLFSLPYFGHLHAKIRDKFIFKIQAIT